MKTTLVQTALAVGIFAGLTGSGSAALLLEETFNYPEGVLTQVSGGIWIQHSGTAGQLDVRNGALQLTQAESEDAFAWLAGRPYMPEKGLTLYARLTLQYSALPSGADGTYFAHFKDAATNFRCRLYASTNGAPAGQFRLGLANGLTGPAQYFPRDLQLHTPYTVVVRYAIDTASSALWIDPTAESDPRVEAVDASTPIEVAAWAVRQSLSGGNGMGTLQLEEVQVATAFTDLIGGPAEPTLLFTNVLSQLIRPGDQPTNSFTELVLCPGETVTATALATDPEGHDVTLSTPPATAPPGLIWTLDTTPGLERSATFTYTATARDAGQRFEVRLQADNGAAQSGVTWTIYVPTLAEQSLVLSEFLARPTADPNAPFFNPLNRALPAALPLVEDEFIELVNRAEVALDLAGWTVADATQIRHRFPTGGSVASSNAVVVYGGPASGEAPVLPVPSFPASEGLEGLNLEDAGLETILVRNAASNLVLRVVYVGEALPNDGSVSRYPDLDGPFLAQNLLATRPVSPGAQFDGRPFSEPAAPLLSVSPLSIRRTADGSVQLSWLADPARVYSVYQADDLTRPFVARIHGLNFPTTAGEFLDPTTAHAPRRFYWVGTPQLRVGF